MFTASDWNPDDWADVFAQSGAKYVILTSKVSVRRDLVTSSITMDSASLQRKQLQSGIHLKWDPREIW